MGVLCRKPIRQCTAAIKLPCILPIILSFMREVNILELILLYQRYACGPYDSHFVCCASNDETGNIFTKIYQEKGVFSFLQHVVHD